MTVGGSILSAFRRSRIWRRSKYSIDEDFGNCDVRCLSLTDLSQHSVVPRRNTFLSSKSEENILESESKRKETWKRRSLFSSVTDSAISLPYVNSPSNSRPKSCVMDYTSGSFYLMSGKQILPVISDVDNGYDSMNMSTDSVSSLVRVDSIQEKSRNIMRRRHKFVKKRQRESQVFSDDENDAKIKNTASQAARIDSQIENRRSVHFDEDEIQNVEKNLSRMKPSVSMVSLIRNNSVQLKSWQIRRQRRAMFNKQKRASRILFQNFKYEERLV